MSSDLAISVRGLSKSYRIRHEEQQTTLAEQALHSIRHPFSRPSMETFWALRDVDLDVRRGEVLGLIGRNGAGKSTLLKVLSRITPPTRGRIDVFGRIGSLLEVGTGFHPELTGRENIYLNGAILGMKKPEIQRQFDGIVDFAGVEKFLDTPVKRYSSGMYVRLAFAVAAHLDTEILLIDEVLSVGDAEFQEKCLGRMKDVATTGRTVIFVSHNLDAVLRLTARCVVLMEGRPAFDGVPSEAVANLLAATAEPSRSTDLRGFSRPNYPQTQRVRITGLCLPQLDRGTLSATHDVHLQVHVERDDAGERFGLLIVVYGPTDGVVGTCALPRIEAPRGASVAVDVALDLSGLRTGRYRLDLVATTPDPFTGYSDHDIVERASTIFLVNDRPEASSTVPPSWGSTALNGSQRAAADLFQGGIR